ncbi:amino acid adenylation domain protein [Rippkaea orientalis PCC 8801]|uniref:Amino acid adenylation domain protein n=1 Tax=Rippkaea orientalis (strain PCC 8801 / RF-1) TaxID=41431 RepID=B7JWG8_RIPO1|nr:non-ribosomal peptide synthetase [Rippkaea orientalis]ACK67013.1 amino acid adenylation domain protein [Rippkaea orientalis PCC 8801]
MQNFDLILEPEINDGYRLSPQQEYTWLLQQSEQYPHFQVNCTVSIVGKLEPDIFEKALQKVVQRHEILHTVFPVIPGMTYPLQKILDNFTINHKFYDLTEFSSINQQKELEAIKHNFKNQPFNFEQTALLESQLIQVKCEEYLLLLRLPALCGDSITLNELLQEISAAYSAIEKHQELEPVEIQYPDIAEWFQELLEDEETEIGRKYWQDKDLSSLNHFSLFIENNYQQNNTFKPHSEPIPLTEGLWCTIRNLTRQYGISSEDFVLASFSVFLFKLTKNSDIIIGKLNNGRSYSELEKAIGLFGKYLPQIVQIEETVSFIELLHKFQEDRLESEKWQDYFNVNHLGSYNFFPYSFDWEESFFYKSINNITFSLQEKYSCLSSFKLKLVGQLIDDSFCLRFDYNSQIFEPTDIQHLAQQFTTLLNNIITTPEAYIYQLDILTVLERQKILIDFNQTAKPYPQDLLIYQKFEEQVQQNPSQIAVVFEEQKLTYEQLNKKSNQLAHYLIANGIKSENIVALYMERSLDFIIGLLAIHKAGAAYLPLDPSFPQEAITFRLKDAEVSLVITQQHLLKNLPDFTTIVNLDSNWESIAKHKEDNPNTEILANNLAYVIYTSGSTGKPKGVSVEHRQLINYVSSIIDRLKLQSNYHFAHVSSFASDLGNTAIFPSLWTGGCLHIISQDRVVDADKLTEYCRQNTIDCLKIVPSHLSTLIAATSCPEEILPHQYLILGGEPLNWELVAEVSKLKPQCQIYNHYGPTETTIGVLTYSVDPQKHPKKAKTVPLGRPINNTEIYLLDEFLNPVPIGVKGELYIGGKNLSRGYLNRPQLTEEKFISNPFRDDLKLYKTGDLARYLPTGDIEYLGRIDHQVKIRGFRLELGEIEAILRNHPEVRETVVVVREDIPGQKRLIAYITSNQVSKLAQVNLNETLKNHLRSKLPEYMIPSVFIPLKTLPLTANGKIDRFNLPNPDKFLIDMETYLPPRTMVEESLVKIWADIFGQEKIGINHNFFELGGDSIISIQVIARANQKGIKITPKQLFEYPTIAELATVAQSSKISLSEQGLITGKAILTPIQEWFFEQNFPEPYHWNQGILLEVESQINIEYLRQGFKQLLIHHDGLRARFQKINNTWTQIYSQPDDVIPFEVIDLSDFSLTEQKTIIERKANDCQRSLDLSQGPIIRGIFFNLGNYQPSRLLIVIHHLVIDGVSWRILLEDLVTIYHQLQQKNSIKLPPKTTSFQQWGEKLKTYVQSEILRQELGYWLKQLSSIIKPLPVDYSSHLEQNTVASMKQITLSLSVEETRSLLQDVPATYNTQINDILLTALGQCLGDWTGQSSILIDLEGHGREDLFEDVNLSRTVGWFTSIFPLLLTLPNTQDLGNIIKSIKEQVRQVPNKGIGYGLLRYLTTDETIKKELKEMPKAQIRFNYMGQFDQSISAPPLLKLATESIGLSESSNGINAYLIYINGTTVSERLEIAWTYSDNLYQQSTIESLAENYMKALQKLIIHCQSVDRRGYTPSDFPSANLNQDELDELLSEID